MEDVEGFKLAGNTNAVIIFLYILKTKNQLYLHELISISMMNDVI